MRGKVVCTAEVEHALHLAEFIQNVDTIVRRRLSPTGDTILSASLAVDVEILSLYELPLMGGVLCEAASPGSWTRQRLTNSICSNSGALEQSGTQP